MNRGHRPPPEDHSSKSGSAWASPRLWIAALICMFLVTLTIYNLHVTRPNPFGSVEQAYRALPKSVRWERDQNGNIPLPITMRGIAARNHFTGQASELEPFLSYLESREIPADEPVSEEFKQVEQPEIANGLRAIARAWPQAPFPREVFDDVLTQALRFARYPDPLIQSQAGLVLLALQDQLHPGDAQSDLALMMLTDGGPFCCKFRETWIGVIENARRAAHEKHPHTSENRNANQRHGPEEAIP